MYRPKLSSVVGVVVAVVVVAGVVVLVREVFGCTPPRAQVDMIDLFKGDPLIDTEPTDGDLVDEHARTYSCDSVMATGGSPTGPGFAEVMKLYTTPTAYSLDQLRQRFDEPAAAAGWHVEEARSGPNYPRVVYCKEAGGRVSYAYVSSTIYSERLEDPTEPAVRVRLSASRDETTTSCTPCCAV